MFLNKNFVSVIFGLLLSLIVVSSNAKWCNETSTTDDPKASCFLQTTPSNPTHLRSSGVTLVLPCHVARSKRSTVEWWYQDFADTIRIKIYPVFPAVRPTVLRFMTSLRPLAKTSNETDISDASVMLKNVNIDDSGIYQCVIRPWSSDAETARDEKSYELTSDLPKLSYHVTLTAPRLCQTTLGSLPCFLSMRTSSPTIIDAYQSAFLQCLVQNHRRPTSVYWIAGDQPRDEKLISTFMSISQHEGDRLRRVFPISQHDYSIEVVINRDVSERTYSCVIGGTSNDVETTLFTYIVRSINLNEDKSEEITTTEATTTTTTSHVSHSTKRILQKIIPHDALTEQEVEEMRQKDQEHHQNEEQIKVGIESDEVHQDKLIQPEETTATI